MISCYSTAASLVVWSCCGNSLADLFAEIPEVYCGLFIYSIFFGLPEEASGFSASFFACLIFMISSLTFCSARRLLISSYLFLRCSSCISVSFNYAFCICYFILLSSSFLISIRSLRFSVFAMVSLYIFSRETEAINHSGKYTLGGSDQI